MYKWKHTKVVFTLMFFISVRWAFWELCLLWLVKCESCFCTKEQSRGAVSWYFWKLWSRFCFSWTVAWSISDVEAIHVLHRMPMWLIQLVWLLHRLLFHPVVRVLFFEPGMHLHVSAWCKQPSTSGIYIIHYFCTCSNQGNLSNPCTIKQSHLRHGTFQNGVLAQRPTVTWAEL